MPNVLDETIWNSELQNWVQFGPKYDVIEFYLSRISFNWPEECLCHIIMIFDKPTKSYIFGDHLDLNMTSYNFLVTSCKFISRISWRMFLLNFNEFRQANLKLLFGVKFGSKFDLTKFLVTSCNLFMRKIGFLDHNIVHANF